MARPRTPTAKAALTGADKINPGRFKPRSEPKASGRTLGAPPAYLPLTAKKAWATFADELPWLTYEDRGAVEIVSLMRAHIMDGLTADLPASFFGNYRMALSSLTSAKASMRWPGCARRTQSNARRAASATRVCSSAKSNTAGSMTPRTAGTTRVSGYFS